MTGAVLLDLVRHGNIEIINGHLIAKSMVTDLPPVHRMVLSKIYSAPKPRKIRKWILWFARHHRKMQEVILYGLQDKGLITVVKKNFLGFGYLRGRLADNGARESLISDIHACILSDTELEGEQSLILALINVCKIHKIICSNKKERKACKKKLEVIMKSDLICRALRKAIDEIHIALIGAITVS
jgi:hypothetical protein